MLRQNMLYTLYSIPNILLPFFGGVFVDRFGARVMLLAFSGTILLGQIIFAIGCTISSFDLMLVRPPPCLLRDRYADLLELTFMS